MVLWTAASCQSGQRLLGERCASTQRRNLASLSQEWQRPSRLFFGMLCGDLGGTPQHMLLFCLENGTSHPVVSLDCASWWSGRYTTAHTARLFLLDKDALRLISSLPC